MVIEEDNEYKQVVYDNILNVYERDLLPLNHLAFLENLCCDKRGDINVIYDIGSCTQHWYRHAKRIWHQAEIICFDAFDYLVDLYDATNVKFENVLLSDVDDLRVKFYQNDLMFGGCSMYRENTSYFPPDKYVIKDTITLDTLIHDRNYPYADLIKIDCQCSELDIVKGGKKVLEHATFLIIEIPEENSNYNIGGYKQHEIIDYLKTIGYYAFAPKFSSNVSDSDWCFININKKRKIYNNI